MKRNIYRYIARLLHGAFCLAALTWVTSCNEVENVNVPDIEPEPEDTSGYEEFLSVTASKQGFLLSDNTWRDGNTLGLFLTRGSLDRHYEGDSVMYANIKATMRGGVWNLNPTLVKLTDKEAVIFACHPYKRGMDPMAMPVETESQTEYMYGTHLAPQRFVMRGRTAATIEMRNALALVEVNLRRSDDFNETAILQELALVPADSTVNLPVKGNLDIQSGDIVPTGYGQYGFNDLDIELADDFNDDSRLRFTVIPRDNFDEEVRLRVRISGHVLEMPLTDEHDWVQGVRSIYNVVFNGDFIQIESTEIAPWHDMNIDVNIRQ